MNRTQLRLLSLNICTSWVIVKSFRRENEELGKKEERICLGMEIGRIYQGMMVQIKNITSCWWISTVIWLPNLHVELTHSGKPVSPPYLIHITKSTEAWLQVIGRLFCFVAGIFCQSPASIQNCWFTRYPHFFQGHLTWVLRESISKSSVLWFLWSFECLYPQLC